MEWRDELRPYADAWYKINDSLGQLSDAELQALLRAAAQASETNCWFGTYNAAQHLRKVIPTIIATRAETGHG